MRCRYRARRRLKASSPAGGHGLHERPRPHRREADCRYPGPACSWLSSYARVEYNYRFFVWTHDVHRAGEAWIEGVNDSQNLNRLHGVLDRRADERLLDWTAYAPRIFWRSLPA